MDVADFMAQLLDRTDFLGPYVCTSLILNLPGSMMHYREWSSVPYHAKPLTEFSYSFPTFLMATNCFFMVQGAVYRLVLREPLLLLLDVIVSRFDITDFTTLQTLATKVYGSEPSMVDAFWDDVCTEKPIRSGTMYV